MFLNRWTSPYGSLQLRVKLSAMTWKPSAMTLDAHIADFATHIHFLDMLESPISRHDQLHRLHRRILPPLRIGIRTFHARSLLSTITHQRQRDSLHSTWSTNKTQATRHHRRFLIFTCQHRDIMLRAKSSVRRDHHYPATSHLSLFHHLLSAYVFLHNMCPRPNNWK
jgi:hypothetical protein